MLRKSIRTEIEKAFILKILILSSAPERNRQAMDLCLILNDRGHEIILITPGYENKKIWLRDNVIHIKLKPLSFNYPFMNRVPFVKGLFNKFRTLINVVKNWRFDLAFAVSESSLYVLGLLKRWANFDLIYYPLEIVSRTIDVRAEKHYSKNAKCFIIPEENRRNLFIERTGCNPERVYVVYNTPRGNVPLKRTRKIREYLMIPEDHKVVLLHGSYQRYLKIENVIRAFDCVKREIHLVLQIIDFIPPHIEDMVRNAGSNVHLIPPVQPSEVNNWVSSADLGLLPYEDELNLGVKYCSPQKLFDYLSCGVPILGSARPLIKKITESYKVGAVVNFANEYEIAKSVNSFFERNECPETVASNVYSVFNDKYNFDKMLEPVFDFLSV